jgi:enoyl-CoA hydratase
VLEETFGRLAKLPRVTIAALHGVAFGGGLELALACDLRLAANDVRIALPEVALGLFPGAGGTQRLPRLVGGSVAKGLIFTGREIGAEEARAIGLVDGIHPADGLLAAAQELAAKVAAGPLVAIALAKQAIDAGSELGLAEGLALERELLEGAFATEDARRGIDSFFTSGPGRASFSGR